MKILQIHNKYLEKGGEDTVVINEGLETARRFSTYEATQFINGILDAIKQDLKKVSDGKHSEASTS